MMKLSAKAQKALQIVVEKFQSGDMSPLVKIATIQLEGSAPVVKWSLGNQILAYAQTGVIDCRGYKQWQAAGRKVRKGTHGAYIFAPMTHKETDPKTGEDIRVPHGFKAISVHPVTNTDGDAVDSLSYEPKDMPPLLETAAALGIKTAWQPLPPDRAAEYNPSTDQINVGTHDTKSFFHELAHAVDTRINGTKLTAGQDPHRETVAEFTACVLMHLYGLGDRTGNAWRYIRHYNADPLTAVTKALSTVGKILDVLTHAAA